MNIVFRVDASIEIASGHLIRCLTLAEALRRRGAQCTFVCRDHEGQMGHRVRLAGFPLILLPAPSEGASELGFDARLGSTQEMDADETRAATAFMTVDWLVVDHYSIGVQWESMLRDHARRILVIDDLEDRRHDCDVLLDQNTLDTNSSPYESLVPVSCRILLGPRYALLAPDYARIRATADRLRERSGSVLVSFGGSDTQNLTGLALEALSAPDFADLTAEVVIGDNNPNLPALREQIALRANTNVHVAPSQLAHLMSRCDLSIGAGGTTAWERVCLRLPSVVVSMAENQLRVCESLTQTGLVEYAGFWTDVTPKTLQVGLLKLISDTPETSPKGAIVVDGLGAARLAELLVPTPFEDTVLRPTSARDTELAPLSVFQPESSANPSSHVGGGSSTAPSPASAAPGEGRVTTWVLETAELPLAAVTFSGSEGLRLRTWGDPVVDGRGWSGRLLRRAFAAHAQTMAPMARRRPPVAPFVTMGAEEAMASGAAVSRSIVVVSDGDSWINDDLGALVLGWLHDGHRVAWAHDVEQAPPGDLCFYLSCSQLAGEAHLSRYQHNLVVHESDLPAGRGWSPLTWQVLEGSSRVAVSLFEAHLGVDSGPIYSQEWLELKGTELVADLRRLQADATLSLCRSFVATYPVSAASPRPQVGTPSSYPKRSPADSTLDAEKPLAEQFDVLRVADNDRYPARLQIRGESYRILIEHDEGS